MLISKYRAMLLSLVLLLGLLAGCTPAQPAAPAPAAPAEVAPAEAASDASALKGVKVAGIFPGTVNDAGWTATAYAALQNLESKYGMEIAYTENVKAEDSAQLARDYADAGFKYIYAHSFDYDAPMRDVAAEYPNTNFIVTNGGLTPPKNMYTVTFAPGEGGFFVGYLGCLVSKSGKTVFVGGVSFPLLDYEVEMAKQGCTDAGKGEVLYSVVGDWNDPAKAKELAVAALQQGVDTFVTIANAGDPAVIEAVNEAYKAGNKDVRLISWSTDKHELGPDFISGGMAQDATVAIEWLITQVIAQGQPGDHYTPGIGQGAIYFFPFYDLVDQTVIDQFNKTVEEYKADPATRPNLKIRKDL
jgi:basic membrane lipoprotein Med (substrate-binding protein (PBP1-ABC) superfamily)